MIKLKNGRIISNIAVSTIMGHSGYGMFPYLLNPNYLKFKRDIHRTKTAILTKSMTRHKNIGNFRSWQPWTYKYIQRIEDDYGRKGILNAHGHTNEGIEHYLPRIKKLISAEYDIIPNLYPDFRKGELSGLVEIGSMIKLCHKFLGSYFDTWEYAAWCPNVPGDSIENDRYIISCVKNAKKYFPDIAIIVKLGIGHSHELIQKLEDCGADAIHMSNTIPFSEIFGPGKISPLQKVGGGAVSGKIAFTKAYIHNINAAIRTSLPIIFGCGISSIADAEKYFSFFKKRKNVSVSICTVVALNTPEARRIILNYNQKN